MPPPSLKLPQKLWPIRMPEDLLEALTRGAEAVGLPTQTFTKYIMRTGLHAWEQDGSLVIPRDEEAALMAQRRKAELEARGIDTSPKRKRKPRGAPKGPAPDGPITAEDAELLKGEPVPLTILVPGIEIEDSGDVGNEPSPGAPTCTTSSWPDAPIEASTFTERAQEAAQRIVPLLEEEREIVLDPQEPDLAGPGVAHPPCSTGNGLYTMGVGIVMGRHCSVCGEPQFDTPHGVTCDNGHGGAEPDQGEQAALEELHAVLGGDSSLEAAPVVQTIEPPVPKPMGEELEELLSMLGPT